MSTTTHRARLSIDVPREVRQRIRIAAIRRDQSIRQYVLEAVEARLREDRIEEVTSGGLLALTGEADPVLAELWDNPRDAAYDEL